MYKLTAAFSNGRTATRTSKTLFPFAWYAENQWNRSTGFASSQEAAQKATRAAFSGCPKPTYTETVSTNVQ